MSLSLSEQSQQWCPTSAKVTVLEARNLRIKGKNGTNDAYAIMQVAKDKFSTSVAEKSVAPVWKEEATFDLPLFHSGNAERCTLYVIVMHRALVGLDKLLGQAVVNLPDLQDNKARKKTDWYKLMDKNGKADKERGEVLLDIQFMRNNMTASMFDLSMQDKPRSRISKLKDKVRGKKKEGLSDSASAIVPSSINPGLTDSEGEGDGNPDSLKSKKSSKLKSLFAPKSNLHRGVSQSMSTLGTLPEKNSSLSSSRSSGLNVESTDVKSRFKFLGHKRTSSTDSKVSLGPFSLLSRSKQNIQEQNNLCINGSHVYAEEQEPKTSSGSSLSLSSSAKGSVEDLRKYHERNASDASNDSFKGLSIPSYKPEPVEKTVHVPQHPQEDGEKKQKKTDGRLQELLERQEEQDRKRQQEREESRKKQEEEERKMRLEEAERKRQEEEERQRKRREEEAKKAEEQRRQEESRVAERLSSLFGLGKKKEETSPPAVENPKHTEIPASANPFEDIPLSPDTAGTFLEGSPADSHKDVRTTFTPTPPTSAFPSRTAKVSAVKPRLAHNPKPETDNNNPLASPVTSDIQTTVLASSLSPKSSPSSDPFESLTMFSEIHSSLAPPKAQRTFAESPRGSMENLSGGGYTTSMSEKKRRAPQPPSYPGTSSKNGNHHPKNEVNSTNPLQSQRPPLPLPDYEALFPRRRHGVMTSTRWEHIIAEVNQRRTDSQLRRPGEEMSVDSPDEPITNKASVLTERTSSSFNQNSKEYIKPPKQALIPPKSSPQVLEDNSTQVHTSEPVYATVDKSNRFAAKDLGSGSAGRIQKPQLNVRRTLNTTLGLISETPEKPTAATRAVKNSNLPEDSNFVNDAMLLPTAKARQKASNIEPVTQVQPEQPTPLRLTLSESAQVERKKASMTNRSSLENRGFEEKMQTLVNVPDMHIVETDDAPKEPPVAGVSKGPEKNLPDSDPFPNDKLISQDPWALPQQNMNQDDLFVHDPKKAKTPEDLGLTSEDFDNIFGSTASKNNVDPFFGSVASNDEKDPFVESVTFKDEKDPFVESVTFKDEKDPFVESVTFKDEKDPFFASVALKNETSPRESHNLSSSFQKGHSQSKKHAPLTPVTLEKTVMEKHTPDPQVMQDTDDVELTVTSVAGPNGGETSISTSKPDLWGMDTFMSPSPVSSSSVTSELVSGSMSGGKTMLRAWVSPSEVQSVSSQSGGGGAFIPRRPHPVKPLSSTESQAPSNISVGLKDLKTPIIREVAEKSKTVESGPYTQLTQEELITLVVKQQSELSKKDAKILELEDYIDNLLVRVIEENPSILMALNSKA